MNSTLKNVKEYIETQLKSYQAIPSKGDFDEGYKSALNGIKKIIEKDKRYKFKI